MTETRDKNNPRPLSVLEQLERIERVRRQKATAEAVVKGILLAVFVAALVTVCVTFACAAMC